jgi:hypothetical protein
MSLINGLRHCPYLEDPPPEKVKQQLLPVEFVVLMAEQS